MAQDGKTWRHHPFQVDQSYEATHTFSGVGGKFIGGESYRLVHIGHSHYDGCSIFTFVPKTSSSKLAWWWPDDDPETTCNLHFKPGEQATASTDQENASKHATPTPTPPSDA